MEMSMLLLIILGIIFYLLYRNGYMIISSKSAVRFVGWMRGKDKCRANFSSCDGYMKRMVHFKSNRIYNFVLDSELTKGEMEVELLDATKRKIMSLNENHQTASVEADKNKKYYLIFRFKSATGKFELNWN